MVHCIYLLVDQFIQYIEIIIIIIILWNNHLINSLCLAKHRKQVHNFPVAVIGWCWSVVVRWQPTTVCLASPNTIRNEIHSPLRFHPHEYVGGGILLCQYRSFGHTKTTTPKWRVPLTGNWIAFHLTKGRFASWEPGSQSVTINSALDGWVGYRHIYRVIFTTTQYCTVI